MYLIVTENLRCAREMGWQQGPVKGLIMPNQLVTLKVHLCKTLAPRYKGNYCVVAVKGNQVELAREGMVLPTKWYNVSHVKPLLQANETINQLPVYDTFGRKGKLAIPTGCGRIFQMDALGSTTMAPLLGGGRQLSFSLPRVRGLLGDLWASLTARGRWAWGGG